MTKLIGIYGAGGCGRGIMPLAREMSELVAPRLVFIDDASKAREINGHAVMSFAEFCAAPEDQKEAALAVSDCYVRARLAFQCAAAAIPLAAVWSKHAVSMDDVVIGDGALVSPFVTFTSNIQIGRCFHANIHSIVEHDCILGDFVTFAPGVRCNGNVTIGDFAYVGAGATIRQGLAIGARAVIGMGAVVTKDVPAGATVIGNPARPLIKD